MTPAMILHPFASEVLLSSVSDAVSSSNGLKYGGVDEAGELDPSARERGTGPAENCLLFPLYCPENDQRSPSPFNYI